MTKKDPSKRKLFKEGSLEEKLDKDSLKPSAKRLREVKQKIRMESAIRNSGVPLHERIPVSDEDERPLNVKDASWQRRTDKWYTNSAKSTSPTPVTLKPEILAPDTSSTIIYWCPICGHHSKDKEVVMCHLADYHTYTEAEEFGYEGIFLALNYDRNKKCFGMKCEATGAPMLYQQMHTHVCSHTYVNDNDLTKKKCNNIFDRVKIAAERASYCKMAIYEDVDGWEDSGEAKEYMRSIEDLE